MGERVETEKKVARGGYLDIPASQSLLTHATNRNEKAMNDWVARSKKGETMRIF